MEPQMSEFSYGYCLTEELMEGPAHRLLGAPIFPTQRQEGQFGGYDLEIPRNGIPLFLQFKLSDYLTRSNSLEWNLHGQPYYRVFLRRRDKSDQHRLMVEWQAAGHEILYSAPVFHTQDELSARYNDARVVESSAFFRPGDIGFLQDDRQHYVTFAPGARIAFSHSESPKQIKPPTLGLQIFDELSEVLERRRIDYDEAFFRGLIQELSDLSQTAKNPALIRRIVDFDAPIRANPLHQIAIRAARIAWALLDSQLVLLHDQPPY